MKEERSKHPELMPMGEKNRYDFQKSSKDNDQSELQDANREKEALDRYILELRRQIAEARQEAD